MPKFDLFHHQHRHRHAGAYDHYNSDDDDHHHSGCESRRQRTQWLRDVFSACTLLLRYDLLGTCSLIWLACQSLAWCYRLVCLGNSVSFQLLPIRRSISPLLQLDLRQWQAVDAPQTTTLHAVLWFLLLSALVRRSEGHNSHMLHNFSVLPASQAMTSHPLASRPLQRQSRYASFRYHNNVVRQIQADSILLAASLMLNMALSAVAPLALSPRATAAGARTWLINTSSLHNWRLFNDHASWTDLLSINSSTRTMITPAAFCLVSLAARAWLEWRLMLCASSMSDHLVNALLQHELRIAPVRATSRVTSIRPASLAPTAISA